MAEEVARPERYYCVDGVGCWRPFLWDTPLKVCEAGDELMIRAPGLIKQKEFANHAPHMLAN
jgi:hypothetical protein